MFTSGYDLFVIKPLSRKNRSPSVHKYEQLRASLLADLESGALKPGDLLPPEPVLADRYNIARGTVRQALGKMERVGLIRRVRGTGTFVHEDAARRLKPGLDAVALVMPEQTGFYPQLLAGVEEEIVASRRQLIVVNTRNDAHRQGDAILQLIDREVAGVVLVPVLTEPATPVYQVRQLQRHGIPVVLCHRGVSGVRAPLLALPFRELGRRAGEEFLRRGHRRVALVSAFPFPQYAESYEAGLRAGLATGGSDLLPRWNLILNVTGQSPHEVFERALDAAWATLTSGPASERPTAIFAPSQFVAELFYLQLLRRGVSMPRDISILTVGPSDRIGPTQHSLSAVTVDENEIGRQAARLIGEMRAGGRPLESDERIDGGIGFHAGQTFAGV